MQREGDGARRGTASEGPEGVFRGGLHTWFHEEDGRSRAQSGARWPERQTWRTQLQQNVSHAARGKRSSAHHKGSTRGRMMHGTRRDGGGEARGKWSSRVSNSRKWAVAYGTHPALQGAEVEARARDGQRGWSDRQTRKGRRTSARGTAKKDRGEEHRERQAVDARAHSVKRPSFASPQRRGAIRTTKSGGGAVRRTSGKARAEGTDQTTREGDGVTAFPPPSLSAHRYDERAMRAIRPSIRAPRTLRTNGIPTFLPTTLFLSFPAMVPAIISVLYSGCRVLVS